MLCEIRLLPKSLWSVLRGISTPANSSPRSNESPKPRCGGRRCAFPPYRAALFRRTAIELVVWACIALSEGLMIAVIIGKTTSE